MTIVDLRYSIKKMKSIYVDSANDCQDAVKGAEAQRVLGMHLTDERIEGFCKVSVCENVTESAVTVMHHAGIGSLQPNTVSGGVFLLVISILVVVLFPIFVFVFDFDFVYVFVFGSILAFTFTLYIFHGLSGAGGPGRAGPLRAF